MSAEIPLFPLNTVLFPGGPLPLRIFEMRYLDMVSRCLKQEEGFGVCLIEQGTETGPARTYTVGTLARIHDWSNGPDGLLNILARGERLTSQGRREAPRRGACGSRSGRSTAESSERSAESAPRRRVSVEEARVVTRSVHR